MGMNSCVLVAPASCGSANSRFSYSQGRELRRIVWPSCIVLISLISRVSSSVPMPAVQHQERAKGKEGGGVDGLLANLLGPVRKSRLPSSSARIWIQSLLYFHHVTPVLTSNLTSFSAFIKTHPSPRPEIPHSSLAAQQLVSSVT